MDCSTGRGGKHRSNARNQRCDNKGLVDVNRTERGCVHCLLCQEQHGDHQNAFILWPQTTIGSPYSHVFLPLCFLPLFPCLISLARGLVNYSGDCIAFVACFVDVVCATVLYFSTPSFFFFDITLEIPSGYLMFFVTSRTFGEWA